MDEMEIQKIERLILKFGDHLRMLNRAALTVKGYLWALKRFVAFLRERDEETLADVAAETLYQYQMSLSRLTVKEGRPASLVYQSALLLAVRVFFRFLVKQGHILSDPAGALEYPRQKRKLPQGVMTRREIERILQHPNTDTPLGLRNKAVMELLYSTGIRNAELRNLAVADVDLANNEIRVRQGKGGRDRVLPLGEVAARCIEQYLEHARPRLLRPAMRRSPPDPPSSLFVSNRGTTFCDRTPLDIVTLHVRGAGIKKTVTPHSFRHTCATHMLKARASLRHIQELLGHKSLDTTQRYTHLAIVDLKKEHKRTHPREQPR